MRLIGIFVAALMSITFITGCSSTGGIGNIGSEKIFGDYETAGRHLGKISYYVYVYMKSNPKYASKVVEIENFYNRMKSEDDKPSVSTINNIVLSMASDAIQAKYGTLETVLIIEAVQICGSYLDGQLADSDATAFLEGFIEGIDEGLATYKVEEVVEKETDEIVPFECNSSKCVFTNYRQYVDINFQDACAKKLLKYQMDDNYKEELKDFRILMKEYRKQGQAATPVTIDQFTIEKVDGKKAVTKLVFVMLTGQKSVEDQIIEVKEKIAATTDEKALAVLEFKLKELEKLLEEGYDARYMEVDCIRCLDGFPEEE